MTGGHAGAARANMRARAPTGTSSFQRRQCMAPSPRAQIGQCRGEPCVPDLVLPRVLHERRRPRCPTAARARISSRKHSRYRRRASPPYSRAAGAIRLVERAGTALGCNPAWSSNELYCLYWQVRGHVSNESKECTDKKDVSLNESGLIYITLHFAFLDFWKKNLQHLKY